MRNKEYLFLVIGREMESSRAFNELIKESFAESEIVLSQDGTDGIHMARKSMPDVIFVNHTPPYTDAFEICRQIKTDNALHEIPVIITTEVSGENDILSRAMESGCDAFLKRPPDKIELVFQLQTMLAAKAARRNRQSERESLTNELKKREEDLRIIQNQMRKREEYEALISGIAAQFVNLSPDLIDDRLKDAQRIVCSFLGIDVSTIYSYDDHTGQIAIKHLYTSSTISLTPEDFDAERHFPWCKKQLFAGHIVNVASTASLPEDAQIDRKSWDYYGIRSSLVFPFIVQDRFFGTISFDMLREMKIWPMNLISQLYVAVQVFGGALSRKYGSKLLADNEERFRIIIENISDTVGITDKDGIIIYRSPNTEKIFGIKAEEVVGKYEYDFVHRQDKKRYQNTFRKAVRGGEGFEVTDEFRFVRNDGTENVVLVTCKNFIDHRLIEGILVTYKDITDRKHAEHTIIEEAERYRSLIESTNDLIWVVDPVRFGLVTFNSAIQHYFRTVSGIDIESGMLPKELFPEASAADWEQMYAKALMDGPYKREYVTTSGKTLQLSIYPMKIDDRTSGISVFGQDITRVRATSLSLRRSKERYQKAQEMGHFGHWSFDPTTQELYTSPETSRIYGFTEGHIIGYETLISCISEKDAKRVERGFVLLIKDGAALNQEFEIRKNGTGETRYIWVIADMQMDESGTHDIVSGVVQDITKRKQLEQKLMEYREHLEDSNRMLAHRLEQSIAAISKIGELRDAYTAGHQRRVKELACAIAAEMGLSDETIKNISYGAIIHDIGKTYIASDILNKPGKISDLEYQMLQTHVAYGYDVVKEIGFPSEIPTMILQHHERIDGSGYPEGLTGDKLLLESKILGVSDVVEAMTSHRPYRPALGLDAALEEIAAFSGQKYDSEVVEICIRLFKEKGFMFS